MLITPTNTKHPFNYPIVQLLSYEVLVCLLLQLNVLVYVFSNPRTNMHMYLISSGFFSHLPPSQVPTDLRDGTCLSIFSVLTPIPLLVKLVSNMLTQVEHSLK